MDLGGGGDLDLLDRHRGRWRGAWPCPTRPAQVWQVADVNTATSQGASGRSKSRRSSCSGNVWRTFVGAAGRRRRSITSATATAAATSTTTSSTRSTPRWSRPACGRSNPGTRISDRRAGPALPSRRRWRCRRRSPARRRSPRPAPARRPRAPPPRRPTMDRRRRRQGETPAGRHGRVPRAVHRGLPAVRGGQQRHRHRPLRVRVEHDEPRPGVRPWGYGDRYRLRAAHLRGTPIRPAVLLCSSRATSRKHGLQGRCRGVGWFMVDDPAVLPDLPGSPSATR